MYSQVYSYDSFITVEYSFQIMSQYFFFFIQYEIPYKRLQNKLTPIPYCKKFKQITTMNLIEQNNDAKTYYYYYYLT